ncbi:MAG: META domain-containing protein [bacterium]|nr:META domain-containing protein [bacterium]
MPMRAFLITAALLVATTAAATPASWLDQPVPDNWNTAGRPVPAAVRDPQAQGDPRCAAQFRIPSKSRADRAVVKAGWSLVGPLQVFGDTELVTAASGADGMCRPLGYQAFVFKGGKFVGTLSPGPMDARTDGIANQIHLVAPDRLHADFARYTDQDPLCCPSAITSVRFEIRGTGKAALVVPVDAQTQPTAASPPTGGVPASDRPLANTYWKLVRLGDRGVTVTEGRREPHLILHVDDRRVSGSGGCNNLNGTYTQEGAALSFGPMASTKMMCAEAMEQERRFLETLGNVRGWRIDGDGLELLDAKGTALAGFTAVDLD